MARDRRSGSKTSCEGCGATPHSRRTRCTCTALLCPRCYNHGNHKMHRPTRAKRRIAR